MKQNENTYVYQSVYICISQYVRSLDCNKFIIPEDFSSSFLNRKQITYPTSKVESVINVRNLSSKKPVVWCGIDGLFE